MQDLVSEIITKEEERFSLHHIGAVTETDSLVPIISGKISFDGDDADFENFRSAVLDCFYREIGFADFVLRQKKTHFETPFFNTLYFYLKKKFNSKDKELSDWEKELGLVHVIAWQLTLSLFSRIRISFSEEKEDFHTAGAVWSYFEKGCSDILPVDFQEFIAQVGEGEEYFCNAFAKIVKKCAENVTKRKNFAFDESLLSSALVEATYTFFVKKLEEEKLKFEAPAQLKAYLARICEISFLEYCRDNKKEFKNSEYIDEIAVCDDKADENDENPDFEGADIDVDITNNYEVARVITVILMNREHPLYQKIVRKDEEKVRLLMEKSINNLSYAEIADKLYGNGISAGEKEKKVISMRKEYERFRVVLKTRYIEIISKKCANTKGRI